MRLGYTDIIHVAPFRIKVEGFELARNGLARATESFRTHMN